MIKYENFNLSQLFTVKSAPSLNKGNLDIFDKKDIQHPYSFIGRTKLNNGVQGYVGRQKKAPIGKNVFSISQIGTVTAQFRETEWYASQNIFILNPNIEIKNLEGTFKFILASLNKMLKETYFEGYSNYPTLKSLATDNISLPVDETGQIDWKYMANIIKKSEEKYAQKVSDYISHMGYGEAEKVKLTSKDEEVLTKEKQTDFKKFVLKNLFDVIERGKRLKADDRIPGELPFITAGVGEMGFSSYIGNPEVKIFPKNSLTIDMFGSTYYRGYTFGADDHVTVLHRNDETFSRHVLQYIQPRIEKAIAGEYSYAKNFYAKDALEIEIELPITNSGKLDTQLMEEYIKVIEKKLILSLNSKK